MKELINYIEKRGAIPRSQISNLENTSPAMIYEFVVGNGYLSQEEVAIAYSEVLSVPLIHLESFILPDELKIIDAEFLIQNRIIPYSFDGSVLTIVMANPLDIKTRDRVSRITGKKIGFLIGVENEILKSIRLNFSAESVIEDIIKDFGQGTEGMSKDDERESIEDHENPIVKLVNSIIVNALEKRASDIHIECYDKKVKVKYRIDGIIHEAASDIDSALHQQIVSRIKIMANLDIAEKRVPQDGRFKHEIKGRSIDFRVSVLPSIYGEVIVIRILDKQAVSLELDQLGFFNEQLKIFKENIRLPYGMILVAGPTGSGKTTTLYSALKWINRMEDKIITIEDPVEYMLPDIVQIPVNEKKGLTFSRGLRSIVRHDPDKIMVGEIRDYETAEIAINAALTGHLVFSTIHANNVIDSIFRLINLGVEPYQFIAAFNLILTQRLIRKICPFCKEEAGKYEDFVVYAGKGCEHCGFTGYFERMAIFEVLPLDDEVKEMIIKKATPMEIERNIRGKGILSLRESCIKLLKKGITTVYELDRVTFSQH